MIISYEQKIMKYSILSIQAKKKKKKKRANKKFYPLQSFAGNDLIV